MKTLISILGIALIAASLTLASPAEATKPLTAALPLPTVSLAKAGPEGYGPMAGCMGGQTRPHQSGMHLLAHAALTCGDGGGYKITSIRLVVRIYARHSADWPWHVYSNRSTIDSRVWQGAVEVNLDDFCALGHGWFWYQVRVTQAVGWSYPQTDSQGTSHRHYRVRSVNRENCGPVE